MTIIHRLRELAVPVIIATVTIGSLYACGVDDDANDAAVLFVGEYTQGFDAEAGDQVNVIMDTTIPGAPERCADMGGKLVVVKRITRCDRVDF
jgi:hypothetical protein